MPGLRVRNRQRRAYHVDTRASTAGQFTPNNIAARMVEDKQNWDKKEVNLKTETYAILGRE